MPYWSFSAWAKRQVKHAVNFIGEFQRVVAEEARKGGANGVICRHIHHAVIEDMDGVRYINTGDWVESRTAIAEDEDGTFELITWRAIADARTIRLAIELATASSSRRLPDFHRSLAVAFRGQPSLFSKTFQKGYFSPWSPFV
jgi:hypothetical protein